MRRSPEIVADVIEKWVNIDDVHAMSFLSRSNPGSVEDIVKLLVPVLQERDIMWNDYAVPGGTMRENMHHEPGTKTLPSNHPGARFRYAELKERYADERWDNVVNRAKETNGEINGNHVTEVNVHA